MRVLVITSTFPRYPGDAQPTFILDLVRHLPDAEVTVLAPAAPEAMLKEASGRLSIRRFRYAPFRSWERLAYGGGMLANVRRNRWLYLLLPAFLVSMCWNIYRASKNNGIDVVHAHWLIPQGFCAALALAMISRDKRPGLLVTAHGADVHIFNGPIGRFAKRMVLRRADAITTVSGALAEKLLVTVGAHAVKPIDVAPMGIAITEVPMSPDRAGFCFVGRFVEKKGLPDLVQAYAMAYARLGEGLPRLTLVGDGPLRETVQVLIDRLGLGAMVTMTGWLEHDQVNAVVGNSVLAIVPSHQARGGDHEGLGLVAVEALCMGTPVLAYDYTALEDIKKLGGGIYVVPEGNVQALAMAMIDIAADPGKHSVNASVVEKARVTFDWVTVGAGYRARYEALIRR